MKQILVYGAIKRENRELQPFIADPKPVSVYILICLFSVPYISIC
jgi:hypothetical protein